MKNSFWNNHTDMHSHIIPGVDDGSVDMEESLQMIKIAYESGVRRLCATPHIREGWRTEPAILRQKLDELIALKNQLGLTDMELLLGAEYMLDEFLMEKLLKREVLTLPGNLVLIETSFYAPPINLDEMLFEIEIKGYTPLIAHPERYDFYQRTPSTYTSLKDKGYLFQLDLMSLQGGYGRSTQKTAKILLEQGMFDYVGSDMHSADDAKIIAQFFKSSESTALPNVPSTK